MARPFLILCMLPPVTASPDLLNRGRVSTTADAGDPCTARVEGVVGLGLTRQPSRRFSHSNRASEREFLIWRRFLQKYLSGFVFRLQTCTITEGKVFSALSGVAWAVLAANGGLRAKVTATQGNTAWIEARIGLNARASGGAFYFAKGNWVRNFLGRPRDAGKKKISEAQAAKK